MKRGRKSFEELEGEREIILIDCNFSFSKKNHSLGKRNVERWLSV